MASVGAFDWLCSLTPLLWSVRLKEALTSSYRISLNFAQMSLRSEATESRRKELWKRTKTWMVVVVYLLLVAIVSIGWLIFLAWLILLVSARIFQ
jgi:hypothetical protein